MPNRHSNKLVIHLDLLKPQSNPEKIFTRLIRWLLSSGRFIFIVVEALVLTAFIARFKLDAELAAKKEAIGQQIPYIESLKPYETLIRQTQLKLTTISSFRKNYIDYSQVLKKIAEQTPVNVKVISLNMDRSVSKISIELTAQSQNSGDASGFAQGLKQDPIFTDVNVVSMSYEKGMLDFSIKAQANIVATQEKNL
ncbi:PilN domain-containing protein [Candidatus Daviesbacteria bacterium]|nr:PilN domain-containing protein [Candidatus Daviesbacteria bacterium]